MPFPSSATFPSLATFPGDEDPPDVAGGVVTAAVLSRRVEATIMETIPRESVELLGLDVRVDNTPTTAYQVSVVADPGRPGTWTAPTVDGDRSGPVLSGLTRGLYRVWVKVGTVVVEAGWVWVS